MAQKPQINMKIFLSQIDKIMEERGIINKKGEPDDPRFDEMMGWKNNLYRWRSGHVKGITLVNLYKISQAFNKSLDWLLLGTGQPQLSEFISEPYEARPMMEIESDLLHQTIEVSEAVIREEKYALSPVEKARLFSRVYNDCAEDRTKPEPVMVKRYLWAMFGPRPGSR